MKFPARSQEYSDRTERNILELYLLVQVNDYLTNTLQAQNPQLFTLVTNYLKQKALKNIEDLGIGAKG